MGYFIFAGDMFVMAFMTLVVVWVMVRATDGYISSSARIPLEDESRDD